MTITTLSSRELNQDVTRAKKATKSGPVPCSSRIAASLLMCC